MAGPLAGNDTGGCRPDDRGPDAQRAQAPAERFRDRERRRPGDVGAAGPRRLGPAGRGVGAPRLTGGAGGSILRPLNAEGAPVAKVPDDLRYTIDHEWTRPDADSGVYVVGITDYAQGELGDVV